MEETDNFDFFQTHVKRYIDLFNNIYKSRVTWPGDKIRSDEFFYRIKNMKTLLHVENLGLPRVPLHFETEVLENVVNYYGNGTMGLRSIPFVATIKEIMKIKKKYVSENKAKYNSSRYSEKNIVLLFSRLYALHHIEFNYLEIPGNQLKKKNNKPNGTFGLPIVGIENRQKRKRNKNIENLPIKLMNIRIDILAKDLTTLKSKNGETYFLKKDAKTISDLFNGIIGETKISCNCQINELGSWFYGLVEMNSFDLKIHYKENIYEWIMKNFTCENNELTMPRLRKLISKKDEKEAGRCKLEGVDFNRYRYNLPQK